MSDTFRLLEAVHDRESFVEFVTALAAERSAAARIEAENPDVYMVDGALGWMNGDIPHFLEAACTRFASRCDDQSKDSEPNWKIFAEFLWCGKIIE